MTNITTMDSSIKSNIEDKIRIASTMYYEGNPIMTDDQFDSLIDQLRSIDPNSPFLKVGWGYIPKDRTVAHIGSQVGSLDKVKIADYNPTINGQVVITPKYDGISAVLYFNDRKYYRAVTRGDGYLGKDITSKVRYIISEHMGIDIDNLSFINGKGIESIRGEIIVPRCNEQSVIELGYSSTTRGFAAGVMNSIEDNRDHLSLLSFMPYTIRNSDMGKMVMYSMFCSDGFYDPCADLQFADIVTTVEDIRKNYNEWRKVYPIDGVVVSVLDTTDVEKDSVAIKFETDEKEAIVEMIEWTTGTTGAIIPVIILSSPVDIHGASIQRISGHNYKFIIDSYIDSGALITVTRANEVIPHVTGVVCPAKYIAVPAVCPSCGGKIDKVGVHLMCINSECTAKLTNQVYNFISICDIDKGLGRSTWDKFLSEYVITDFESMVSFLNMINTDGVIKDIKNDLITLVGNSMGEKLIGAINKMARKIKDINNYEILMSMNVPNLGDTYARRLGQYSMKYIKEHFEKGDNLGTNISVLTNLLPRLDRIMDIMEHLSIYDNPITPTPKSTLTKVCITGKLSYGTRSAFGSAIRPFGFEDTGSVTKDIKYLISNESSGSSKYKAAVSMGIKIVTEEEFLNLEDINLNNM